MDSPRTLIILVEIVYLLYMFRCFKTKINLTYSWTPQHGFFKHPLGHSPCPINQICPFGHTAIILLVIILALPVIEPRTSFIVKPSLLIAFLISLVNLNATVYLLPVLFIEFAFF